jgi:hypothetical protein
MATIDLTTGIPYAKPGRTLLIVPLVDKASPAAPTPRDLSFRAWARGIEARRRAATARRPAIYLSDRPR